MRLRVARMLLATAVMAAVFVWSTPGAGACSCVATTEQESFDRGDAVFEGTVTSMEILDDQLAVLTFEVTGVYKGDARQTQPIYTHAQSTACGVTVDVGDAYVVFADVIDGTEPDAGYPIGDLRADSCNGTRPVDAGVLDVNPRPDPVAPIADAPTTTTLVRPTTGAEQVAEPATGGGVFVFGFIAVGIIGAFIASRIAKRSRES